MPRKGARARETNNTARVVAQLRMARCCKAALLILQLLDQPLQLADVSFRELAMAAEMRDEGRNPAAVKAVEQTLALSREPLLARQRRRVDEAPAILLRAHGALLEQATEQSLDGRLLPVTRLGERSHDILCRGGPLLPQDREDGGLRFADGLRCAHVQAERLRL